MLLSNRQTTFYGSLSSAYRFITGKDSAILTSPFFLQKQIHKSKLILSFLLQSDYICHDGVGEFSLPNP